MRISDWSSDVCSSDLWSTAPRRIGDKIGRLLGANPGEIVATDSTSVNIFKALTAALSLRRERSVILSEATNFPTVVYMMQGIEAFSGDRKSTSLNSSHYCASRMPSSG